MSRHGCDPLLVTARLRLRLPAPQDAAFVHRLLNDPDWLLNIGDRGVYSEADALRYIEERLLASHRAHGFGLWVMEPRGGGPALGLAGLLKRDELPDADLGYALAPEARQQGYALEAAACALRFAWQAKGLQRVIAIVQPFNHPSRRVLEKLGMQLEGLIPFNGRDTCLYGLSNSSHTMRFAPPSAT
jgi:[ribosomal protein S5]-alanine N-acetyltransferase